MLGLGEIGYTCVRVEANGSNNSQKIIVLGSFLKWTVMESEVMHMTIIDM